MFTVFETGQSGVQRHEVATGNTETIWNSPEFGGHVAFDATYWTPWGTHITAEESWCSDPTGCTESPFGRLFEFRNPTTAPAITEPFTPSSNDGADFVHRNAIPRTSHEGIQFDKARNMYFIDELNGGSLYKFTSAASWGEIKSGRREYFDAGQTFVLRVGDGNTPNATGGYTWVPITDANGAALPGAITITDPNGVTSVDARNTTELAAFKGTDYQRPEDMQLQTVNGREYLYVTTTTTNEVYRLALGTNTISVFTNRATTDLATGAPVGSAFTSPDNLAIDHDGNIYIVEDRGGGVDNDIWFAKDLNDDGDLDRRRRRNRSLGVERHRGLGIHRSLLRPDEQASGVGQHPTPRQRQRPHHRDHNSLTGTPPSTTFRHTRANRGCACVVSALAFPAATVPPHPNGGSGVRQPAQCPTGAAPYRRSQSCCWGWAGRATLAPPRSYSRSIHRPDVRTILDRHPAAAVEAPLKITVVTAGNDAAMILVRADPAVTFGRYPAIADLGSELHAITIDLLTPATYPSAELIRL